MNSVISIILFIVLVILFLLGPIHEYQNGGSTLMFIIGITTSLFFAAWITDIVIASAGLDVWKPIDTLSSLYYGICSSIVYVITMTLLAIIESVNRITRYNSTRPRRVMDEAGDSMKYYSNPVFVKSQDICDSCVRFLRGNGVTTILECDMCSNCRQRQVEIRLENAKRLESITANPNPTPGHGISQSTTQQVNDNPTLGHGISQSTTQQVNDNPTLGHGVSQSTTQQVNDNPTLGHGVNQPTVKQN